ncbi:hypothetical protein [Croceivirga thetidis]|uniref:DUF4249 family protein n=1 Tax=Croceivirga thetidis TaxID=2721623 RepID=A0ABX1GWJ8_9FLAO|nr:hypothetical protein [Croceivirga thetidis]NKI33386.1 hypothetical protein [Croceivirga thetidis]
MKKWIGIVLVVLFLVWACDDRDDNLLAPNIRIQNLSSQNFILVEVRNDSILFENIAPEGFSPYLELETAYFQDTLRIEADSTQFTFIPDSIGEPLPIGLYTYQLNIIEGDSLTFNFKLD